MTHTTIFFDISFTFRLNESQTFGFTIVCGAQDHQRTEDVIWRNYARHTSNIDTFFLEKSHFFCFSSKLGGFTRAIKKKLFLPIFAEKT